MKVVGIVSEFNPMHLGHVWLIDKIREEYGDDTVIVSVMSGDFVQRGEPACIDKFIRAKTAVLNGVDLVIELPIPWSISSAESFAENAVKILKAIDSLSVIAFGSECGNKDIIEKTAEALISDNVDKRIKQELKKGISYASARQKALNYYYPELSEIISTPNNILGVEYAKANIRYKMGLELFTVKRNGSMHDQNSEGIIKSANEIRNKLKNNEDISKYVSKITFDIIEESKSNGTFIYDNKNLEAAIVSRLRMFDKEKFKDLPWSEGGVGNSLYKSIKNNSNLEMIAMRAKTKNIALSRIKRMMMCAAIGIDKEIMNFEPEYLRILACNENGIKLLRNETDIPVLTKPADVNKFNERSKRIFDVGSKAHDLYVLGYREGTESICGNDYRKGPYISKIK